MYCTHYSYEYRTRIYNAAALLVPQNLAKPGKTPTDPNYDFIQGTRTSTIPDTVRYRCQLENWTCVRPGQTCVGTTDEKDRRRVFEHF